MEFRHPAFGVLTLDSGIWSGEAQHEGRRLRFYIGGTDTAPDAGLLNRVRELVERFPEVERAALNYLRAQEPSIRDVTLDFYSIDFCWEDEPHLYALEFIVAGDESGVWRVEFANGEPNYVARDD